LAAISASTFNPYLLAIRLGVSPAFTMWVRGAVAAAAIARLATAGLGEVPAAEPVGADDTDAAGGETRTATRGTAAGELVSACKRLV
jgi:hypothetical protein